MLFLPDSWTSAQVERCAATLWKMRDGAISAPFSVFRRNMGQDDALRRKPGEKENCVTGRENLPKHRFPQDDEKMNHSSLNPLTVKRSISFKCTSSMFSCWHLILSLNSAKNWLVHNYACAVAYWHLVGNMEIHWIKRWNDCLFH